MSTFTSGAASARRRVASAPDMPGMLRSIKHHVGAHVRREPHPVLPSPASPTTLRPCSARQLAQPAPEQVVIVHDHHPDLLGH